MGHKNWSNARAGRVVHFWQKQVGHQLDFRGLWKWLLLGGILGVAVGLASIVFQMSLEALSMFSFKSLIGVELGSPGGEQPDFDLPLAKQFTPWLILVLPTVGAFIAGLIVFKFAPEAQGHGTDAAIGAFHHGHGKIRARVPIVKMFASIITMGSGGSGGREGPVAQIGAGIGSYIADKFHLNAKTRRLLLAAGIAAGVGSIFRAPLAGAIFAAEVLYSGPELESEVILPAAVASIVGYSVFGAKFGYDHMFTNVGSFGLSSPLELGPYLILGIIVALGALLYVKSFYGISFLFEKMPIPRIFKPALGGFLTGLLGLSLYLYTDDVHVLDIMSTGYGVLQDILHGSGFEVGLGVLLIVAVGKILTTSFTIGSGGSAGVFGPSMVIGGALGAAVGQVLHMVMPELVPHPSVFAIVGMAGFFSAAANTPISTLVMVSELTGNYELLVPSMWVCSISFLVARRWSIYHRQVPSRIHSPAHLGEGAAEMLANSKVKEVYKATRKYVKVAADMTLGEVFDRTAETRQRIFPVYDVGGQIVGCFNLNDLTHALHYDPEAAKTMTAVELCSPTILKVCLDDSVEKALSLMTFHHVEELLVSPEYDKNSVVGIMTNADVLLHYNRQLLLAKLRDEDDTRSTEAMKNEEEPDAEERA